MALVRTIQDDIVELSDTVARACADITRGSKFEDHTLWDDLVSYSDQASRVYIKSPSVSDRRILAFVAPCVLLREIYTNGPAASESGSEFPFQFDGIATNGVHTAASHVCGRLAEVLLATDLCSLNETSVIIRDGSPLQDYVCIHRLCVELSGVRGLKAYRWRALEELHSCCERIPVYQEKCVALAHGIAANVFIFNAMKCKLNNAQTSAVQACVPEEAVFTVTPSYTQHADTSEYMRAALDRRVHEQLCGSTPFRTEESSIQDALDSACALLECPVINVLVKL